MQPATTTPSQANTSGDGTILPPASPVAPTTAPPPGAVNAQADQLTAAGLTSGTTPPPSILPTNVASPAPAFQFTAPDMPTVGYVDPSQYGDVTSLSAAEAKAQSDLMNQQAGLEKNVFGQYQQAINSQGSALDRYNQLSQQMNLPLYQQQVSTIKGLLSRLTDNINTRAAGTFMSQAQRDQLEATEGKSLNNQLAPLAQAQTDAESNIAKMMDYTNQDNQAHLDPIKAYLASLDSAFGRQLTGLNNNNQSASQALQAKLEAKAKADAEAWNESYQAKDLALRQSIADQTNKYNNFMAGIASRAAAPAAAAAPAKPALSDAQVNAAMTLRSLGGAPDPNYTSPMTPNMKAGLNTDSKDSWAPSWLKNWLGL